MWAWVNKHERAVSAAAMVAGFVVDQTFFGRVDLPITQAVFLAYIAICFVSITLLHWIESRVERGRVRPRWRSILPVATQFALGGFWSGFLFFYGRSAVLGASWPFLLLLVAVLIGNEVLKKYHDRLVFTSVLFFFAVYSYAIFALPIVVGNMGTLVFLESGLFAIGFFAIFTICLRVAGRTRFLRDVWKIRIGALGVLVLINVFYFTNVLPPLPLAAKEVGIYLSVSKNIDGTYTALAEPESLEARYFGINRILQVTPGESLSAYSSVFAPVKLDTAIKHQWQWYDPTFKKWMTEATVSFPISGGRDGGYRGYSTKSNLTAGAWRVNVETTDGRLIAQIPFTIEVVATAPAEESISLP